MFITKVLNINLITLIYAHFYVQKSDFSFKRVIHLLVICVFPCSYKFALDELYPMMAAVKLRAESYRDWLCNVQDILEHKQIKKRGKKSMQ